MSPKLPINWPILISSFTHILSFALHPLFTHFVLTDISFTYPATLALVQVATTAVCLWFWSVFGLYRVRRIALRALLPLAASAAALAWLAVFTLATTSLLVFQTARLLSATFVLAIGTRSAVPLLLAFLSSAVLLIRNDTNLFIPLCYAMFASLNALIIHPIAATTKASELQLQVLLRTLASALLLPALFLDDYSNSPTSIRHFAFDDTATILVFSTGLVSFFSFIASRATVNRLEPEMHNWLLLIANLAVFVCHFVTTEDEYGGTEIVGVLGLTAAWSFLAERRRCGLEECEDLEEREWEAV